MSGPDDIRTGRCLCGDVTVEVTDLGHEINACHCTFCTRWGGGVQLGIGMNPEDVRFTGPIKSHRSTALAERAWCDTCGSHVWFRYVSGKDAGYLELSPGLFDNAGGAFLTRVVYADRHPDGFWLDGKDVTRVSQMEYEAVEPHVQEET